MSNHDFHFGRFLLIALALLLLGIVFDVVGGILGGFIAGACIAAGVSGLVLGLVTLAALVVSERADRRMTPAETLST